MTQIAANPVRLAELIASLEQRLSPVKETRLGESHFTSEKGCLKLIDKIEGCWDRFVECIIRLFCAIFGIKRELQSTFEQITQELKEALDLAKVDTSETKQKWGEFVTAYSPAVQDMFKAGVKLDRASATCFGGRAYPMECLKELEGSEIQKSFTGYFRGLEQVELSHSLAKAKQHVGGFGLQISGPSTVAGFLTVGNRQFFLRALDGGTFFSTDEELKEAGHRLLSEMREHLRSVFSDPAPAKVEGSFYAVCDSDTGEGFKLVMASGDTVRQGDLKTYRDVNQVLAHYSTELLEKDEQGRWCFPAPELQKTIGPPLRDRNEVKNSSVFFEVNYSTVTLKSKQITYPALIDGRVKIGEKAFFLELPKEKSFFDSKEELECALEQLLLQILRYMERASDPAVLDCKREGMDAKSCFTVVCKLEGDSYATYTVGFEMTRGKADRDNSTFAPCETYEAVSKMLAEIDSEAKLEKNERDQWVFSHPIAK